MLSLGSRLGAEIAAVDSRCRLCGEPLDASANHGLCCSKAEATRGHYAVVAAAADGFSAVDPGIQTEVAGLVPSAERPADILTSAGVPGALTACDVTIIAPDAVASGRDACATGYRRKMTKYQGHFPTLWRAGVVFRPMVWSAEGRRAHPATSRLLDNTVRLFQNRHGKAEATSMRVKWKHELGVALQRRKAAMIRSVLPGLSNRQQWLQGQGASEGAQRPLPPIIEESCGEEQ